MITLRGLLLDVLELYKHAFAFESRRKCDLDNISAEEISILSPSVADYLLTCAHLRYTPLINHLMMQPNSADIIVFIS